MGIDHAKPVAAPLNQTTVQAEMEKSYQAYAMAVITSRALPDSRDGQKPVHRRILYGMSQGYGSEGPHKKSARIVGDVMGKYHPHGDSSIYEAMVRMGQPFSTRVMFVDGQGNYGSIDGDPAAAMRYTEARLTRIADEAVVADLTEIMANLPGEGHNPYIRATYDDTGVEPTVLPVRFPVLLVNGVGGIAVGMATEMPPHNLGEVIDATLAFIANPTITVDELMRHLPGPDFPTGGIIQGRTGIREAYLTGHGSIPMAAVHGVETAKGGRQSIVITELPYQVNKTALVTRIASLINRKTIEGVTDLRDESDANIRIVIELKRDVEPALVISLLRKETDIQMTFAYNGTCLRPNKVPAVMGLTEILRTFVTFRGEIIHRRTEYRLNKARTELGRQVGLYAVRTQVDEVIRLIRAASNREAARLALMSLEFPTRTATGAEAELAVLLREVDPDIDLPETFRLDEAQAKAVLELQLQRLAALEQDLIADRARELLATIRGLEPIISDKAVLMALMCSELTEIKAKFNTPRRTKIEMEAPEDISDDELVENKPVVLTLTRVGYVKITSLDAYREQIRGGKGKTGMETKEDDFVTHTLVCMTRDTLIFFTSRGVAHTLKAYKIPEVAPNAKGKPIINYISKMRQGETIAAVMPAPLGDAAADDRFMVLVTDGGDVRRNAASDFAVVNKGGKIAMKLEDEFGNPIARLIDVLACSENDDLVLATRRGKAARFPVSEVRVFKSRDSIGIAGIKLGEGDAVIAAAVVRHFDSPYQERAAYLAGGSTTYKDDDNVEHEVQITPERMAELEAAEQTLLTVSARGYGKRFSSYDFRATGRGAQGVWVGQFGDVSGDLVACFPVVSADGVVLVTDGGQAIRTRCSEVRKMGRNTRGVTLFELPAGQSIVGVARVPAIEAT